MADEALILVKERRFEDKESKGKAFQMVHIKDHANETYSGLVTEDLIVPTQGETTKVIFQDLGNYKSIIRFESTEEKITMAEKKEPTSALEVKGTVYYAHVKYPDTKGEFSKGDFKLDLSVSANVKTALLDLGLAVKNKGDTKGDFITVRSKFRPVVYLDGEEVKEENIPLIGNGTEAVVKGYLYPNKAPSGGKKLLGLNTLSISKLVPYEDKTIRLE